MTLLVAVKVPAKNAPIKWLNPAKRPLRFTEPGIIIAADTRFSWNGRGPTDDSQKLWPLGDRTFSGYAGEVCVAEKAVLSAFSALRHHGRCDDREFTILVTKKYLEYWEREARRDRAPGLLGPTIVFVGHLTATGVPKLYRFASDEQFKPRERTGVLAEGTGRDIYRRIWPAEVDHITWQWSAPARSGLKIVERDGRPEAVRRDQDDFIDIPMLSVANMVGATADRAIHEAGRSDVGGGGQLMTLSEKGMYSPKAFGSSDRGATWRARRRP